MLVSLWRLTTSGAGWVRHHTIFKGENENTVHVGPEPDSRLPGVRLRLDKRHVLLTLQLMHMHDQVEGRRQHHNLHPNPSPTTDCGRSTGQAGEGNMGINSFAVVLVLVLVLLQTSVHKHNRVPISTLLWICMVLRLLPGVGATSSSMGEPLQYCEFGMVEGVPLQSISTLPGNHVLMCARERDDATGLNKYI